MDLWSFVWSKSFRHQHLWYIFMWRTVGMYSTEYFEASFSVFQELQVICSEKVLSSCFSIFQKIYKWYAHLDIIGRYYMLSTVASDLSFLAQCLLISSGEEPLLYSFATYLAISLGKTWYWIKERWKRICLVILSKYGDCLKIQLSIETESWIKAKVIQSIFLCFSNPCYGSLDEESCWGRLNSSNHLICHNNFSIVKNKAASYWRTQIELNCASRSYYNRKCLVQYIVNEVLQQTVVVVVGIVSVLNKHFLEIEIVTVNSASLTDGD